MNKKIIDIDINGDPIKIYKIAEELKIEDKKTFVLDIKKSLENYKECVITSTTQKEQKESFKKIYKTCSKII